MLVSRNDLLCEEVKKIVLERHLKLKEEQVGVSLIESEGIGKSRYGISISGVSGDFLFDIGYKAQKYHKKATSIAVYLILASDIQQDVENRILVGKFSKSYGLPDAFEMNKASEGADYQGLFAACKRYGLTNPFDEQENSADKSAKLEMKSGY